MTFETGVIFTTAIGRGPITALLTGKALGGIEWWNLLGPCWPSLRLASRSTPAAQWVQCGSGMGHTMQSSLARRLMLTYARVVTTTSAGM